MLISPESGLKLSASSSTGATVDYQQAMAKVLTLSTTSIAIGKFFLGPIIDKYGGIITLQISLLLLSIIMFIISTTSSFKVFSICWIFVDFIFSTSWPSCLNAIYYYFDNEVEWTNVISLLGIASRVGNTLAFATFAFLLSYFQQRKHTNPFFIKNNQYWRSVFLVSSIVQFIPLTLLTIFHRRSAITTNNTANTPQVKHKQKQPSSIQVLKKHIKTVPFWLHLLSRSSFYLYHH